MAAKIKRIILVRVQGRRPRRFVCFDAFNRYVRGVDPTLNVRVSYSAK